MMESMTLLELAVWKAKLNQVEVQHSIDRDAYHIDIPGPVKDNIYWVIFHIIELCYSIY